MDSKKVLEKLLKIASNQQKIIMKLAQDQGVVPTLTPQHMDPNKPQLRPADKVLQALPPAVRQTVNTLEEHGNEMRVQFQPGKATQPNYDAVLKTLQDLTNQNVLQRAYTLKVV
jgi:hypothetical protein